MGMKFETAKAVGAAASWGLKNIFHSEAGNFPGKLALYADSEFIRNARGRCEKGSVLVVGTNGKTTVTNLLADCLQMAHQSVMCNRGGANLASGVATVLLENEHADWGIFEIDELWLAQVSPGLQPTYVLLLNLFRDQLDRMGETDTIQRSIAQGLKASPDTILIYNADDPNCAAIAASVQNKSVAFGVGESMQLPQEACTVAHMCTQCGAALTYQYRQYDQLGSYRCTACEFARPELDYAACNVTINAGGLGFDIEGRHVRDAAVEGLRLHARWNGAYMVYNLAAIATAALLTGCSLEQVQDAVDAFDPRNGRLQWSHVHGRDMLLNLAKNPTGFNQNLQIILQDEHPSVAAFFVNDAEGDGRDPSWIWNVDFEVLAARPDIVVCVGGTRAEDVRVRLKYAGVPTQPVRSAHDVIAAMDAAGLPTEAHAYVIANYTALPALRAEVAKMPEGGRDAMGMPAVSKASVPPSNATESVSPCDSEGCLADACTDARPVAIVLLYPDLLGVYGDGGNASVLAQRLRWRGIPVQVRAPRHGEALDFDEVDLVVIGASMEREQKLAAQCLMPYARKMHQFVEAGGVVLGIGGGYRMLGQTWTIDGKTVPCMGLVEVETKERADGARVLGDVAVESSLASAPIIGYVNSTGIAKPKPSLEPFGRVVAQKGAAGKGEAEHGVDGVMFKGIVGTELHGPVLAKNPALADELLRRALQRWAMRTGNAVPALTPLDDSLEHAAYDVMAQRLGMQKQ